MIFIAKVVLQLSGLTKATKTLSDAKSLKSEVLQPVESEYRAFVLKRFDKYSRGAGDWPDISEETKKRKGSSAILVDTRAMRLGLAADGVGVADVRFGPNGVQLVFAFTNVETHPKVKNLTIADLASVHHAGQGRVPERAILVAPPPDVRRRMAERGVAAIAKAFV